ncbi:MAG: OmpA family protein [Bacteroidaceae bacterium]|nr:OmpA family protein [Bacteroidaceae bacterium]
MKKLMMLLAFCGVASFAVAQDANESYPTLKHKIVTNGFWDNWFIDVAGTHLSFYSDQEHGHGLNKNPFWPGRRSWGGELSVGKWATPVLGLRVKAQAAWGTQVNMDWDDPAYVSGSNPTFNQVNLSLQPMVNLTNLFGGYKPRIWDISLYGGFGTIANLEGDNNWSMLYSLGLYNTINVSKRFHIAWDMYLNMSEDKMDGIAGPKKDPRIIKTRDVQFGVALGLGVNLGKVGWDNAPDMDAILANHQAQLDALNNSISDLEAENAALKNKIANHKCPEAKEKVVTVTEFQATSASVFFNINKSTIASKKDLVNVKELAEFAKAHDKKIVVTGYADSKTGSAAYNQTLSEKRAEAVKQALVDMGVSASNIETVGQGGVADLNPYSYNRRAVVSLK